MRSRRLLGVVGAMALSATVVLSALPAGASSGRNSVREHHRSERSEGWRGGDSGRDRHRSSNDEGRCRVASAGLSVVHGVPDLAVDIYVVKNFREVKKLTNVNFGTAADLGAAFPGFVTEGLYFVDIVPTGASPWKPLLTATTVLGAGENKSVVAYVTANAAGVAGGPTLGVFDNDVSSTNGQSRVTVRHLAVAPTVGVYANGAVAISQAFSNGDTATAVVPAGTYGVTVTAPNTPSTVLANIGDVALAANTNTLAFAIGTYGSTFQVASVQVPTAT